MEIQSDGSNETAKSTLNDLRQQLQSRTQSQRTVQLELLAALQAQLVPNIVSSIDLSLKVVSSFNNRPFAPTPPLPQPKPNPRKTLEPNRALTPETQPKQPPFTESTPSDPKAQTTKPLSDSNPVRHSDGEPFSPIDESGSPLSVVRSMVAVCLLERVPFLPIDSSTVLRKLENDQNATLAEKAALREVGGESGAILAVEMALRSMAEDNRGVELEEFVVSGKSRVMVLAIDRSQLVKELPESTQFQPQEATLTDGNANQNHYHNQNQQQVVTSGVDINGGVFAMSVQVPRPMPDIWMGPNDPHMSGLPPMFLGSGPPGGLMGPRGGPRGVMSMMGMARGIGVPPLHRPPMGPNSGIGGNAVKIKTEEDDMKDLEALLNKKSFRELQKSKTGEELLDLIHRPTAKETAVAAKVCDYKAFQFSYRCIAILIVG